LSAIDCCLLLAISVLPVSDYVAATDDPKDVKILLSMRSIPTSALRIVLLLLLAGLIRCEVAAQSRALTLVDTMQLPSDLKITISSDDEARCDSAGNLLLPVGDGIEEPSAPLAKISSSGKLLATISLTSAPGFENAVINDFSDGPDGMTYVLASKVTRRWVERDANGKAQSSGYAQELGRWLLVFGSDGAFVSKARLAGSIDVITFAAFANGNILAVGFTESDRSFAGIFSRSGELIRRVTLPDDLYREKKKGQRVGNYLVRLRVGDDGNAYLITGRYLPKLSVFSPDGSLIVSNSIELPENTDEPAMEQFSQGKMVVALMFRGRVESHSVFADRVFAIYDTRTGKLLNQYQTGFLEVDNSLVCYSNETLSFIPTDGRVIHVRRPRPRDTTPAASRGSQRR